MFCFVFFPSDDLNYLIINNRLFASEKELFQPQT